MITFIYHTSPSTYRIGALGLPARIIQAGRPKSRLCAEEKSTVYSLRIKRWRYFNCTRNMYCHFVNPNINYSCQSANRCEQNKKVHALYTHALILSLYSYGGKQGYAASHDNWPKKQSYPCRST